MGVSVVIAAIVAITVPLKDGPARIGRRAADSCGYVGFAGGQLQGRAGEFGGDLVPQASPAKHRVVAVAYLDGRDLGDRASPFGVGPGVVRTCDTVRVPVHEQHAPAPSWSTGSPGGSQGARPATADTA